MSLVLRGTEGITFPDASLQPIAAVTTPPFNCGRFVYESPTMCRFVPFNGDKIKIQGTVYTIPPAGVPIPNTDVNVGGIPNSNLAGNTVYLVALYWSGAQLLPFFTAVASGHSPSSAAGNVGTEIITGLENATLIGMVYVVGGSFSYTPTHRGVLSWFNRQNMIGHASFGATSTASAGVYVTVGAAMNILNWAGEAVHSVFTGAMYNDTYSHWCALVVGLDNSAGGQGTSGSETNATWYIPAGGGLMLEPAEGGHYWSMMAAVSGGTGTFWAELGVCTRG